VALAVAVGIRALRFEVAFPGDGTVQFTSDDATYHARRALYSFVNFPSVLDFDPYIAYPDGAPVPWPPLYDWALAGVARLFGRSTLTFERVAVWASPVLSALTLVPVFAMGRRLGGTGVGLGAAWLFALLPASSNRSDGASTTAPPPAPMRVAAPASGFPMRPTPMRRHAPRARIG